MKYLWFYMNLMFIFFVRMHSKFKRVFNKQWGKKVFSQPPIVQVLPLKNLNYERQNKKIK